MKKRRAAQAKKKKTSDDCNVAAHSSVTSGPKVAEEHCSKAGVVGDKSSAKIPAETKTAEGKINACTVVKV